MVAVVGVWVKALWMEVNLLVVMAVLRALVVMGIVSGFGISSGLLSVGFRTGSMSVISMLASCSPKGVM